MVNVEMAWDLLLLRSGAGIRSALYTLLTLKLLIRLLQPRVVCERLIDDTELLRVSLPFSRRGEVDLRHGSIAVADVKSPHWSVLGGEKRLLDRLGNPGVSGMRNSSSLSRSKGFGLSRFW